MSDAAEPRPNAELGAVAKAAGRWTGTNRFRLMPDDEFAASDGTAEVRTHAKGLAVTIAYTWAESGVDQEGVLLISPAPDDGLQAAWLDSWHQPAPWMTLTGTSDAGVITLNGSYPGGGRWQIRVDPANGLRLGMRNAVPDVDLYDVVDAVFTRAD